MNILGIIPARYNSSRFPGKPLAEIKGKSMIHRVYEQAKQVSAFTKIIVATDDLRILEHVEFFGGNVLMTATTHQSGTDRCGEVITTLPGEYDIVVNIQGDEPFIQPSQLQKLIDIFHDDKVTIATLAKKITDAKQIADPNIVKVVFSSNHDVLYFSRSIIPGNKTGIQDIKTDYFKHLGIYAYRTEVLECIVKLKQTPLEVAESLEQLRWLENGFSIRIVETEIESISIDTPADLEKLIS
ncbi:MAG: 3-deoxy-manno-octulosonate cytidylyltransferase [Chitinophagales bacterium]